MSVRRLPSDAFQHFLGLGDSRTYQRVAAHYGCTKRTVVRRARAEGWQRRLIDIQRKASERADADAVESLATVNKRHLRILKAVEAKALSALQNTNMRTAGEAAKALLAALAQEREIHSVPGAAAPTVVLVSTGVPRPQDQAEVMRQRNRERLREAGFEDPDGLLADQREF